jgi:hypothetical protein
VEEQHWRPWSSARLAMVVALWHNWKPATHAGAVGRVRPRAFVALRQPTARLGQGGHELCSSDRQWRPEGRCHAQREQIGRERGEGRRRTEGGWGGARAVAQLLHHAK